MEYLNELGVKLPDPEVEAEEAPVEEDTAGKGFADEA